METGAGPPLWGLARRPWREGGGRGAPQQDRCFLLRLPKSRTHPQVLGDVPQPVGSVGSAQACGPKALRFRSC